MFKTVASAVEKGVVLDLYQVSMNLEFCYSPKFAFYRAIVVNILENLVGSALIALLPSLSFQQDTVSVDTGNANIKY